MDPRKKPIRIYLYVSMRIIYKRSMDDAQYLFKELNLCGNFRFFSPLSLSIQTGTVGLFALGTVLLWANSFKDSVFLFISLLVKHITIKIVLLLQL